MVKAWISACRLRTLPLASSSIIVGNALAAHYLIFSLPIFLLTLSTALSLQILSNLANDFGDFDKGTDNHNRVGPERALQSGAINRSQMKIGIAINIIITLILGTTLLYISLPEIDLKFLFMFGLGVVAIGAAIKYTIGKNAYGYSGFGDIFVFIFFGIVGVIGSFWLQTQKIDDKIWFLAYSSGVFSVAVLNLNNMRDIDNDIISNKMTIPARIGLKLAKRYQSLLILSGIYSTIWFLYLLDFSGFSTIIIFSLLPMILFNYQISKITINQEFDPFLKKIALSTFLWSVLILIGLG